MNTIQKQVLKQAWAIFGPLRWQIVVVLGLIFVGQGLSLTTPYIQGTLLDNLSQRRDWSAAQLLFYATVVFMLVNHWVISFPREIIENTKIDFQLAEAAEDQTMERMTKLSVGQHTMMHSDLKKSVINRGQHSLTALVHMLIYEILPTLSKSCIMLVALFLMDWRMGIINLIAVAIFLAMTLWLNYTHKDKLRKLELMWNKESRFRSEILNNMVHVLLNAQERKAIAEADAKYAEVVGFARPMWQRFIVFSYVKALPIIAAQATITYLGIYYVYAGKYTLGKVAVMWSWSTIALNGLWAVGHLQRQIIRMWTSIKRYCTFLSMETDVPIAENPVRLERISGRVEIKNLSYAYESRMKQDHEDNSEDEDVEKVSDDKPKPAALHDINLLIQPGETVALVGSSGAGKSTLINLLLRSNDPIEGVITIDGYDLKDLDLTCYKHQVGLVEQKVPLWDQTIQYNITHSLNGKAADVTKERLDEVVEMAQLTELVRRCEKGLDTPIGDRGVKLSGGEQQRVGIARALMKDPGMLILDEATSSLDAETEYQIREAVRRASRGRTTIIIAHRFSTIQHANRIIVLDKGRIVGQGTHAELYDSCPAYQRLVSRQLTNQDQLAEVIA